MIRTMPRRPVSVHPSIVPRQQPIERAEKVDVGSGTQLHDDNSSRRMRHEDIQEPVTLALDESRASCCQIKEARLVPRADR